MIKKAGGFIVDKIAVPLSLAGMVLVILLANANPYFYAPNRDNCLFLFIAKTILKGGTLYRDVWDNKPPA